MSDIPSSSQPHTTPGSLGSLEVLPVVFATPRTAVALLLVSSLLGNFGWVLYNVNATSIRQAITPMALPVRGLARIPEAA